jgi:hypothetical protein
LKTVCTSSGAILGDNCSVKISLSFSIDASEFTTPETISTEDGSSKFVLDGLSDEIRQLLETLSPTQKEILYIILSQENISGHIYEIANAENTMPEILVDEINDIATQYIGDILIDTFGDEMCVLEQYADELKKAMK